MAAAVEDSTAAAVVMVAADIAKLIAPFQI
jgi:hypothetical protein